MKIKIPYEFYQKIQTYAQLADGEISGFGSIGRDGSVSRLLPLLTQACDGGETEMFNSALKELAMTKDSSKVHMQWHSHGFNTLFWSSQDEACIKNLSMFLPFLVSIEVNKEGKHICRFDQFKPYWIKIENVELDIQYPALNFNLVNKMKLEVKEKVTKKVYEFIDKDIQFTDNDPSIKELAEYFGMDEAEYMHYAGGTQANKWFREEYARQNPKKPDVKRNGDNKGNQLSLIKPSEDNLSFHNKEIKMIETLERMGWEFTGDLNHPLIKKKVEVKVESRKPS